MLDQCVIGWNCSCCWWSNCSDCVTAELNADSSALEGYLPDPDPGSSLDNLGWAGMGAGEQTGVLQNQNRGRKREKMAEMVPLLVSSSSSSRFESVECQCDQIRQFIAFWATFQSLGQQLFCPNCIFREFFVKLSKSFLGNFIDGLAIFYWSHCRGGPIQQNFCDVTNGNVAKFWRVISPTLPIKVLYHRESNSNHGSTYGQLKPEVDRY